MKHFCVICWAKWFCGIGKCRPKCSGNFLTMCDKCLISIPLRQYRNLPPRKYFKSKKSK